MTAPIGHNAGPTIDNARRLTVRTAWAKALFADPETPTYVMAMAWVIHWYSDKDGKGAALSNEQFMEICNLSRPTVTKGKSWLVNNGYIKIKLGDGRGLKSTFTLTVPETYKEETALPPMEEAAFPETTFPETTKQETSLQKGATALPKGETTLPPIQDNNQEYNQPSAPARARGTGRAYWAKHTSPHSYNPDADVVFDGRKLTLVNGLRSEWLAKFGGSDERLDLALTAVAGRIQPNSSRALIVQVEAALADMVSKKHDSDARYAAAAQANKSTGKRHDGEDERFNKLMKSI